MKQKKHLALKACTKAFVVSAAALLIGVMSSNFGSLDAKAASDSVVAPRNIYVSADNTGYKLNNDAATDSLPIGEDKTFTSVSVGVSDGGSINQGQYNNYTAYGVTGSSASVYLTINMGKDLGGGDWYLGNDSYGGTSGETVMGMAASGAIGSGMVLVRTSSDAQNWSRLDSSKYANGLTTTDFATDLKEGDCVKIYTPAGSDVQKGVYVEVNYLYEIATHWQTEEWEWYKRLLFGIKLGSPTIKDHYAYKNVVEHTVFYLVSDEVSAVTFHNLSVEKETLTGADGESINYLTRAETLTNNAVTSTGFKIDQSLLPSASVSVKRNGETYHVSSDKKITQDGCYDITVTSRLGKTKKTRIYVDTRDFSDTCNYYFGEGLLAGSKRIYDKGELPVYEAGLTQYALQEVGSNYLPLSGYVKNLTTGSVIQIEHTRTAKSGTLTEAGEYEVVLCNNPTFDSTTRSGDCKKLTFKFNLIENGTAPGPQINQENLAKYMQSNVSDLKPFFYAVTQRSAGRGDITIAFATYQKAYDFAYAQNVGLVEEMSDGSYRYFGHFVTQSKEKYENGFDLTAAINYFTEQSVTVNYFDLSNENGFSYTTLDDGLLDGRNLRMLELSSSVVVFASKEDRDALLQNAKIPLIGLKKSSVLETGMEETVKQEVQDFVFLRDSLGIDSEYVSVLDAMGNMYSIEYGKGFAQQLVEYNLPTGNYTVIETTIYGDSTSYSIRYIAPNDNTATVVMAYSYKGEIFETQLNQATTQESITVLCNEFKLSIIDEMDISYVKVTKKGAFEDGFSQEDLDGLAFNEEGEYRIVCVNTLGYTFSFNVMVEMFMPITISFSEGQFEGINTYYSATNILLPEMEKYGYNFKGYVDTDGNQYNGAIEEVIFTRDTVLMPVWEAKRYSLILNYMDNKVETQEIEFGSETILPAAEAPTDYTFEGWYDKESGERVRECFTLSTEGNVTLNARFVKAYSNVTFDIGAERHQSKYAVGASFLLPQLSKKGYVFQGWLLDGKEYNADGYTVGGKDCVFEAVWLEETLPQPIPQPDDSGSQDFVPKTAMEETGKDSSTIVIIIISGSLAVIFGGIYLVKTLKKKENY